MTGKYFQMTVALTLASVSREYRVCHHSNDQFRRTEQREDGTGNFPTISRIGSH